MSEPSDKELREVHETMVADGWRTPGTINTDTVRIAYPIIERLVRKRLDAEHISAMQDAARAIVKMEGQRNDARAKLQAMSADNDRLREYAEQQIRNSVKGSIADDHARFALGDVPKSKDLRRQRLRNLTLRQLEDVVNTAADIMDWCDEALEKCPLCQREDGMHEPEAMCTKLKEALDIYADIKDVKNNRTQ